MPRTCEKRNTNRCKKKGASEGAFLKQLKASQDHFGLNGRSGETLCHGNPWQSMAIHPDTAAEGYST